MFFSLTYKWSCKLDWQWIWTLRKRICCIPIFLRMAIPSRAGLFGKGKFLHKANFILAFIQCFSVWPINETVNWTDSECQHFESECVVSISFFEWPFLLERAYSEMGNFYTELILYLHLYNVFHFGKSVGKSVKILCKRCKN